MNILYVALSTFLSISVLFIFSKIIGYRQMSQLSVFDYINGITIGSIAAELAMSTDGDFVLPLTAMAIYSIVSYLISIITNKSIILRRFFVGKPLVLFENGKILEHNFKKAHLDINEFLEQCRNKGYFDISQIKTAILESNGKISILPDERFRPVNTSDLNLAPEQDAVLVNVIIDGKILQNNLKSKGLNEAWLRKQLDLQMIKKIEDVFLATCDCSNNLAVYVKLENPVHKDYFE